MYIPASGLWRPRAVVLPVLAVIGIAFAPSSWAQGTTSVDPLDPSVSSKTDYSSVFEGYRSFRAGAVGNWRTINESVTTGGGHGALREGAPEAKQESPGNPKSATATPEPAPPAVPREPVHMAPLGEHSPRGSAKGKP